MQRIFMFMITSTLLCFAACSPIADIADEKGTSDQPDQVLSAASPDDTVAPLALTRTIYKEGEDLAFSAAASASRYTGDLILHFADGHTATTRLQDDRPRFALADDAITTRDAIEPASLWYAPQGAEAQLIAELQVIDVSPDSDVFHFIAVALIEDEDGTMVARPDQTVVLYDEQVGQAIDWANSDAYGQVLFPNLDRARNTDYRIEYTP